MKRALLVTPPAPARNGNRVTALRWAKRLRELGWSTQVAHGWDGRPRDLLIGLHAGKSADAIHGFAERGGGRLVVALTGTDVYGGLDAAARRSLALADDLVVLQPLAGDALPAEVRGKVRVIRQSAVSIDPARCLGDPPRALSGSFSKRLLNQADSGVTVVVLAHLRAVKAPLLAAEAVQRLPPTCRVTVFHLGDALEPGWVDAARAAEHATAGRWRWMGARPRSEALRALAAASLLAVTSRAEGGANAVTEAIAAGVPVISTRIDGSVGILGPDHPGYFRVDDADDLAALLHRCAVDPHLLPRLAAAGRALLPLVDPALERASWAELLR